MKRIIILSLLAQFVIGAAFAQREDAVLLSSDTVRHDVYDDLSLRLRGEIEEHRKDPRVKDYAFADISFGGGFYAAEQNRYANNALSRLRTSAQMSIGKWVLPHMAVRFGLGYGHFVGDYQPIHAWNMFDKGDHSAPVGYEKYMYTDAKGYTWFKREFDLIDAQVDLIFDLNSAFTKRVTPFDTYVYVGAAYGQTLASQQITSNKSFAAKAGFSVSYNITKKFYIRGAIEGSICDETLDGQFDGTNSGANRTIEGYAQCFLGVGIKFGSRKYEKYVLKTVDNIKRTYQIEEPPVGEDFKAPFVVRFFIDQYNIEPDQELNITKVCKYLQAHPKARLLMTGHCDPETANPKYNQALSERRCNSVLKYIDQHFGISRSRIDVKPMGDTQRNFDEDFRWNRCVILTILEQ